MKLFSFLRRAKADRAALSLGALPRTVKDIEAELERKRLESSRRPLRALSELPAERLAAFLATEHPQTVALVLAHLEPARQGDVLAELPESLRPEILLRVATLKEVSDERLDELEALVAREIARATSEERKPPPGVAAVREMVSRLEPTEAAAVVAKLAALDPALGAALTSQLDLSQP